MNRYTLSFILIFITIILNGQQKPSFVALQAGASIPVGQFHGKELPDEGFAQAGFAGSLEGAWFFKPWIGVGASSGVYIHPVDVMTLSDEKLKASPFLADLVIRSEPYLSMSIYGGLFFQFPLAGKLSVTAKALGGLLYAQTPYQLYKAEYQMFGKNWYDITSAGDFEGSFLAGAGLRYDLNDYLGLSFNSEFTYNQCEFEFLMLDGTTRTENKIFAYVNLGLGVMFRIK